jgi:hypothetical protein
MWKINKTIKLGILKGQIQAIIPKLIKYITLKLSTVKMAYFKFFKNN